uniref:DDE superfamily endonuclease n=1 Tax=Nothobranchius furzeri TaxID=105023 RepID=A0A1A8VF77_NOTFU
MSLLVSLHSELLNILSNTLYIHLENPIFKEFHGNLHRLLFSGEPYLTLMKTGVCPGDNRTMYVVVWDNVSFHHSAVVRQWFAAHGRMLMEFLPPYTPFLNPTEEFFSSWRWKVYDRHPHTQMALLAAMDAACDDITAESCRGWIRHSRRYFPRCIDRADVPCDADENVWADRRERLDIRFSHFISLLSDFCIFYCFIHLLAALLLPYCLFIQCLYVQHHAALLLFFLIAPRG